MTAMGDEGTAQARGEELQRLVEELYPICRSLTGEGVRKTLLWMQSVIPLEIHEVPSGTAVLDWTVPNEWNIRDAWVADSSGRRVIDFRASNLHVVSYSTPVRSTMSLAELRPHLYSLPDHPDWVPYRTSYYVDDWGFCLSDRQLRTLADGDYEVVIDSTLEPGSLTYGEYVLPGKTNDEVLISAHICHPSLCNDNLSSIAISAFLARGLAMRKKRHYTYRFLYAPGTIGAVTWLASHMDTLAKLRFGLTLSSLGDASPLKYKRTFGGSRPIDRAAEYALRVSGRPHEVLDYYPYGYDERQYNSPGFRLPVGSLMRAQHGQFPEYHTSADNLDFVSGCQLADSLSALTEIIDVVEGDRTYKSLAPFGEPQLGRRGLYRSVGGAGDPAPLQFAVLWNLVCADGEHSLVDIASRSDLPFATIREAATLLEIHGLIEELDIS